MSACHTNAAVLRRSCLCGAQCCLRLVVMVHWQTDFAHLLVQVEVALVVGFLIQVQLKKNIQTPNLEEQTINES